MGKFRDLAIGLFFLLAAFYLYKASLVLEARRENLDAIVFNVRLASIDAKETLRVARDATRQQTDFIKQQTDAFKAQNENLAGYFKAGPVFLHTVSSLDRAASNVAGLTERIEYDKLAEGAIVLRDTISAYRDTGNAATTALRRGDLLLASSAQFIQNADGVITRSLQNRILPTLNETIKDYGILAQQGSTSLRIFNDRWPTTLDHLNDFLSHASGSAAQVEIGLTRFNKPKTLLEKLRAIAVASLLQSSPVLLGR